MQVIRSFAIFVLLCSTMTQCIGVQAQRRHRRQQQDVGNLEFRNFLGDTSLEDDDFKITTQLNLLDEIEKAQRQQQAYEYEIQQQQEKLRKLKEQFENQLQEQQRKQQQLEREQEKQRQQQYELKMIQQEQQELQEKILQQQLQLEQQQQSTIAPEQQHFEPTPSPQQQLQRRPSQKQQQYNPYASILVKDDYNSEYNPAESNFYERHSDGTYAYGYALPNGVRRFERSYYSAELESMIVEGFYTEVREWDTHTSYELHCYRSGPYGYRPMPVRTLDHAPLVRRNTTLDDDCIDNNIETNLF